MHGYDIDGVCSKGIEKKFPYVVISGRTISEWNDKGLYTELAKDSPVYIRGKGVAGDRDDSAKFKAMMIDYLGIDTFYEDEEYQANIIKSLCPKCNVIIFK
jgi:hypothetical protein